VFDLLTGLAGVLAGALGAMVGIGGGVLIVPLLHGMLGLSFREATGVSLVGVLATSDREGAPEGWEATYISEYATMHPWEDFAESFAHYLHITDSLTTAAAGGLMLQASRVDGLVDADIEPRRSYQGVSTSDMLADWQWLSLLLNRVNHAMGRSDLYPFTLTEAVRIKLDFVHRVVQDVANRNAGEPVLACTPRAYS
jgi:hypothetical protein